MRIVLALLLAAAVSATLGAQSPVDGGPAGSARGAQTPAGPPIDASKLGVSMSRIQEGLRMSAARDEATGSPLKLEYQVQVYGALPRIDILGDFDIGAQAPLPSGAPTHNDFVNQWTPQAYRSPPMPLSNLASWALFQIVKRSEKSKCEQEIANYRALVMQGVPAPAPRCTQ